MRQGFSVIHQKICECGKIVSYKIVFSLTFLYIWREASNHRGFFFGSHFPKEMVHFHFHSFFSWMEDTSTFHITCKCGVHGIWRTESVQKRHATFYFPFGTERTMNVKVVMSWKKTYFGKLFIHAEIFWATKEDK